MKVAGQIQLLPPDFATFFVDRCLGRKTFAQPLKDFGYSIEIHDEHFDTETPDEIWIPEVTRRSWIIVSADFRIRHRPPEIEAFRACGARMLLIAQKLSVEDRVEMSLDAHHKIGKAIRSWKAPWIARIVPDRPIQAPGRRRAQLDLLQR